MNFKPLHDRVLISRLEEKNKTESGIIIPDNHKKKPVEGVVKATGPGNVNDKGDIVSMTVKVGDKVLFAEWGGTEVKISKENFLIMKESDILGIIQ
jgi:chaperonin GroES